MPHMMRAVVVHGPENYVLEQIPVPTPGPGEALVKVEAVGICASDLKAYHGAAKFWGDEDRPAWTETEVLPGPEFVGTIVELDAKPPPVGKWPWETGSRPSRSSHAGSAATAFAASTGCAPRTSCTASSGRRPEAWPNI